jgi:hypothetical protein
VIANPKQVRIIAYAKIKTDTIDAGVLAHDRPMNAAMFEEWVEKCLVVGRQLSQLGPDR